MKHMKKFLTMLIAIAIAVSLLPSVSFAQPEGGGMRPSITNPVEAGENYTGGIYAIDWGDTDWGGFQDVDWTDAAELSAADLAERLKERGVNVLAFDGQIEFENGELCMDDEPIPVEKLGGITVDESTITFPEGDTALIIPTRNSGAFETDDDVVLDIPDGANVAVIAVAKDGANPILTYTIWGFSSADAFTVNTNTSGNLAVVNLVDSALSAHGMLMNGELYIGGTGTVAVVGGKSGDSSIGIYADSVHVDGASLIAAGDYAMGTSWGIHAAKGLDYSDEYTGGITADNGALVIGVGGGALGDSVGIETMNTAATNGSEICAYGGVVPVDDDDDNDMRTIGLQIMEGTAKRTVTADNGGKIYARAGNGEFRYGIAEYYTDLDLEDASAIEYGGVEFVVDESENAAPSEIVASGADDAYHQRREHDSNIEKKPVQSPVG